MTIFKTIGTLFAKAWNAVTLKNVNKRHKSAYECYLDKSTDVHDLEARERSWNSKMQNRNMY